MSIFVVFPLKLTWSDGNENHEITWNFQDDGIRDLSVKAMQKAVIQVAEDKKTREAEERDKHWENEKCPKCDQPLWEKTKTPGVRVKITPESFNSKKSKGKGG